VSEYEIIKIQSRYEGRYEDFTDIIFRRFYFIIFFRSGKSTSIRYFLFIII